MCVFVGSLDVQVRLQGSGIITGGLCTVKQIHMLCGLHGLLPHHDMSVLTLPFNLTAGIEFGLWTTGINLQLDNKAASKGKRDVGKFYVAVAIPLLADHDFNGVYSCNKPGSVSTVVFQIMRAEDRQKALYHRHHAGRKI